MRTSILMAALVAAFGMQAAVAQNVNSDADKARVEEQTNQQKENGTTGTATGERSDSKRANQSTGNSGNTSGNPTADRSSDQPPGAGRTKDDMKAQDQSKADDEMARAENGQAKQGDSGNTPGQSQTGVGHPEDAKTTGHGQGVKESDSGTANNSGATGGSATGGGTKSGSDARQ